MNIPYFLPDIGTGSGDPALVAIRQLDEKYDYREDAIRSAETGNYVLHFVHSVSFVGEMDALNIAARSRPKDMLVINEKGEVGVVLESVVVKIESDRGRWDYVIEFGGTGSKDNRSISSNLKPSPGPDDPQDNNNYDLKNETWSISHSQYQFPIERYLNADEMQKFSRWVSQNDLDKKSKFLYPTESAGSQTQEYHELTGRSLEVAKLYYAGITSVLRHYPVCSKVTRYELKFNPIQVPVTTVIDGVETTLSSLQVMDPTDPDKPLKSYNDIIRQTIAGNFVNKLDSIDNTPNEIYPSEYSWLYVQDDWQEVEAGRAWIRTQTWQGSEHWDSRLYKDWEFVTNENQ